MDNTQKKLFPENIRNIAITAPAGPPSPQALQEELQLLGSMNVKILNYLPQSCNSAAPGYLAADRSERLLLLNNAIADPATDLILCARGGFGCMHLLEGINYQLLRQRNLPVIGYSDITALHCAMLSKKAGIAIAGTNLLSLHQLTDKFSIHSHYAALSSPGQSFGLTAPQALKPLNQAADKPITARAYGANLTVLAALCGTEFMPDFQDMILIVEDINEPLYKIDRLLTQLTLNHCFDNLQALVFGSFTGSADASELQQLLTSMANSLKCACFMNFPFGHSFPMCAINSSRQLTLTPDSRVLTVN